MPSTLPRRGFAPRAQTLFALLTALALGLIAASPAQGGPRRDSDGDGLSNRFEIRRSHTNPHRADTDRDGLTDGYEVRRSHTSPRNQDTDGDGIADGVEVLAGSDPLKGADRPAPPQPPPPPPPSNTAPPPPSNTAPPPPSNTTPPPAPALPPPSGACDSNVTTAAALLSAAKSSQNEGKVVCARVGSYAGQRFADISHSTKVTLKAHPGEQVTLGQSDLVNVQGLRFEGFRMPQGGFDLQPSNNQRIEIVGNDIGGCQCFGALVWYGSKDILIQGNRMHDMLRPSSQSQFGMGYGVSSRGGNGRVENLRIVRNTIERTQNDALEIGSTYGGEISANIVREAWPAGCSPAQTNCPSGAEHTDGLMYWSGSSDFTIKDNRFIDNWQGWLLSGGSYRTIIENNLLVRSRGLCVDAGDTGSSSAGIHQFTFRANTFYDCGRDFGGGGAGGRYGLLIRGASSDTNRLERNLLTSVEGNGPSAISVSENNNILNGYRLGANDTAIVPQFADQVNYLPTNVPGQVGYRAAPAGAP